MRSAATTKPPVVVRAPPRQEAAFFPHPSDASRGSEPVTTGSGFGGATDGASAWTAARPLVRRGRRGVRRGAAALLPAGRGPRAGGARARAGPDVLDLAAGTGRLTRELVGRFASVVAVEP